MAVDPELNTEFKKHEITEKPGVFSGDRLKFGAYLVSDIDHDWTRGKGMSIGETFKSESSKQGYRYKFEGKDKWSADCLRKGKSKQVLVVKFGMEEGMDCTYKQNSNNLTFKMSIKGAHWVDAKGDFKIGKESYKITTVSKLENSSFKTGTPTGYHIYAEEKLIAAVDLVSKNGPVWFNRNLSSKNQEKISIVIASLILNKKQN